MRTKRSITGSEPERIGKALQRAIQESGMNQREIATELEVSNATMSRWCSGDILASRDNVAAVERLIERPPGYVERLAGYISDPESTRDSILMSEDVNDGYRRIALRMWDEAVNASREERDGRAVRRRKSS